MKKIFVTVLTSIAVCNVCFCQDIKLTSGQKLYCMPKPHYDLTVKQYTTENSIVNTVNLIPGKWKIIKFTNIGDKLSKHYDAVIIKANSKLENRTYLIKYEDLGEFKYIIDGANNCIDEEYTKLNQIYDSLSDSSKLADKKYQTDTAVFNTAKRQERDETIEIAKYLADTSLYVIKTGFYRHFDRLKDTLQTLMTAKTKSASEKIAVTSVYLDTDSAGGNDVHIDFVNLSDKTIKYVYFNCDYYNRVNDKVYCTIRGTDISRLKVTGPIEEGEMYSAEWSKIIYNHSADYAIIKSIRIIYMDGSEYNVSLTKQEGNLLQHYGVQLERIAMCLQVMNQIPDDITQYTDIKKSYGFDYYEKFDLAKKLYDMVSDVYKDYHTTVVNELVKYSDEIVKNDAACWKVWHNSLSEISNLKREAAIKLNQFIEVGIDENFQYHIISKQ